MRLQRFLQRSSAQIRRAAYPRHCIVEDAHHVVIKVSLSHGHDKKVLRRFHQANQRDSGLKNQTADRNV